MSVFKALLATAIFAVVSATASAATPTNASADLVYEDGLSYKAGVKADGSDANAHPVDEVTNTHQTNKMTEQQRIAYYNHKFVQRKIRQSKIMAENEAMALELAD